MNRRGFLGALLAAPLAARVKAAPNEVTPSEFMHVEYGVSFEVTDEVLEDNCEVLGAEYQGDGIVWSRNQMKRTWYRRI